MIPKLKSDTGDRWNRFRKKDGAYQGCSTDIKLILNYFVYNTTC